MADFGIDVEKLEEEAEWQRWKCNIRLMLRYHGLLEIVDGVEKKPSPEETAISVTDWTRRDAQAQLIITTHIDMAIFKRLGTFESSCEAWQRLISIYEQSSKHRLDRFSEEFFTAKKDRGQDMMSYVSNMQRTFHDLRNEMMNQLKVDLPEQLLMLRIMSTLPEEYSAFRQIWEATSLEERSMDVLIEGLRMFDLNDATDRSTTTFVTNNGQATKLKNIVFRAGKICYYCRTEGHFARECKMTRSENIEENYWIFDTTATSHLTGIRELFNEYSPFSKLRNVYLADGSKFQAMGTGNISLQTQVGNSWRNIDLNNVWYVPNIEVNLFAASASLEKGDEWMLMRDRVTCRRNGKILLVGERENGLITLDLRAIK